jgi:hypothetical protein
MTNHDLDLEDQGYRDGRLDRSPAHTSTYYQQGYCLGRADRLQHGQTLDQLFQNFQLSKGDPLMWSVWFYRPNSDRRLLNRYNARNEAEAYRQGMQRIVGSMFQVVVCFEQPDSEPIPNQF